MRFFCSFYVVLFKTLWKRKNEGYKNKSKWEIKSDNAVLIQKKNGVVRVTSIKDMIMRTRSKIEDYILWGLHYLADSKCLLWAVLRVWVGGNVRNWYRKGWNCVLSGKLRITCTYWATMRIILQIIFKPGNGRTKKQGSNSNLQFHLSSKYSICHWNSRSFFEGYMDHQSGFIDGKLN